MSLKPFTEKNSKLKYWNLFGPGSVIPQADTHQNKADPKHWLQRWAGAPNFVPVGHSLRVGGRRGLSYVMLKSRNYFIWRRFSYTFIKKWTYVSSNLMTTQGRPKYVHILLNSQNILFLCVK